MAKTLTLHLPEPPSANRWWRKFRNRMVLSEAARAYKLTVRGEAMRASGTLTTVFPTEHVSVIMTWRRSRKAGDLDKRIGIVLDGLQGPVFANDNQVVTILAHRVDNKENAGLTVTVEAIPTESATPQSRPPR